MRQWVLRTLSSNARSRVCGRIFRPMHSGADGAMTRIRSTKGFFTTLRCVGALAATSLLAACNPFGEASVADRAPEQWPLVERYCTDCHNGAELAGGFDFEKINPHNVAQHAEQL